MIKSLWLSALGISCMCLVLLAGGCREEQEGADPNAELKQSTTVESSAAAAPQLDLEALGDFDGDGQIEMAVEQGGEEMGGLLGAYGFAGVQSYARFAREITDQRRRILNLSAQRLDAVDVLGVGDVRGQVRLLRLQGLQIICAPAAPGMDFGNVWMIDRIGF